MKLTAARDILFKAKDKDASALASPKEKREEIKAARQ